MDFDFFAKELLPKVSKAPVINFMGGEPTLHPRFVEMMKLTYEAITPGFSRPVHQWFDERKGAGPVGQHRRAQRSALAQNLFRRTPELADARKHFRKITSCQEIAETLLRVNGFSVTFSINLYSKIRTSPPSAEIDAIYQNAGLPRDQMYRIRVSPAFPIVGGESNAYLPIRDYPAAGRVMFAMLKNIRRCVSASTAPFHPVFSTIFRKTKCISPSVLLSRIQTDPGDGNLGPAGFVFRLRRRQSDGYRRQGRLFQLFPLS